MMDRQYFIDEFIQSFDGKFHRISIFDLRKDNYHNLNDIIVDMIESMEMNMNLVELRDIKSSTILNNNNYISLELFQQRYYELLTLLSSQIHLKKDPIPIVIIFRSLESLPSLLFHNINQYFNHSKFHLIFIGFQSSSSSIHIQCPYENTLSLSYRIYETLTPFQLYEKSLFKILLSSHLKVKFSFQIISWIREQFFCCNRSVWSVMNM
jgi:hypothetical protein